MAGTRGRLLVTAVVALLIWPAAAHGATINVTTTADELDAMPDGACSLREAVESAKTNLPKGGCVQGEPSMDTIKLKGEDYELTIPSTNESFNVNGDLDVMGGGPVVIKGAGTAATDVFTDLPDRVIDVHNATQATLRSMTITGGDVSSLDAGSFFGGDIRMDDGGNLTLDRLLVNGGTARYGGAVDHNGPGKLTVKRSTFTSNHATGAGGAIVADDDVTSKISKSTLESNTVTNPTSASEGAGIRTDGDTTITDSSIVANTAAAAASEAAGGGAVATGGTAELTVRRSLIAGNTASTPTAAVFEGGGGIYAIGSAGATVTVTNSTLYDNAAGSPDGHGGGIYNLGGQVLVNHTTMNENVAGDEGGDVYSQPAGYVFLRNSILEGADPCGGSANFDSAGRNLAEVNDPDCEFGVLDETAVTDFGFKTGSPRDNGGLTKTIKIKRSSPARNLVPLANCASAEGEDQRRYKRPKGKACDSGSFEQGAKR